MELEFQLTEEDYVNFNMDHAKKSETMKKSILIQRILGPIIFMVAPFVITRFSDIPLWYWLIVFIILSFIWFFYYPNYAEWEIKRRVKKMFTEGNNENLFNVRKLIVDGERLSEISAIGESKVSWDKVISLDESEDYLYIYLSSVSAHIIPKRVFKNIQEQEEFISKVSQQIDNKNL